MNTLSIILLGLLGLNFGWFVYSKFLANHVFKLSRNFITPAHELYDDTDYVPSNKFVLWGHHFTSVAGAAPIIGPAIAVYWGWLPAVLWIVIGTIFFAGVHDLGALWASTRNKGKSIGAVAESAINKRVRILFMLVVFFVLLMVNSVFGVVIANSLVNTPSSVIPVWSAILVALIIGQLLRRKMAPLALLTACGVFLLYSSIYIGSAQPIELAQTLPGLGEPATWIIILFVYAAIASMLPVWALLQPRDFINGAQLIIGLLLLYGAALLTTPDVSAPAFNMQTAKETPSIIPLLFVTIACGAVSGFHGIVASGTSSKQLDKETDARFVGYFSAIGEGALALITLVTVSSIALAASPKEWHEIYAHFGDGAVSAFISGGSQLIQNGWAIPSEISTTLLSTMVILFAATTMDSGVRLQRYIIQEWGVIYRIGWLRNSYIATVIAVSSCLLLSFGAAGSDGTGGMVIWPLFGSTNQILAGLTLLIISALLIKLKRPSYVTLIPMTFVLLMAIIASSITLLDFVEENNYLLVTINAFVTVIALIVVFEAISIVKKRPDTDSKLKEINHKDY